MKSPFFVYKHELLIKQDHHGQQTKHRPFHKTSASGDNQQSNFLAKAATKWLWPYLCILSCYSSIIGLWLFPFLFLYIRFHSLHSSLLKRTRKKKGKRKRKTMVYQMSCQHVFRDLANNFLTECYKITLYKYCNHFLIIILKIPLLTWDTITSWGSRRHHHIF